MLPFRSTARALALTVALLAAPAAHAQQDLRSPDTREQSSVYSDYAPAQDLRSGDARDAALGRGTFNAPDVVVVTQPAPVADDGIDWRDVGIGAGAVVGLALLALGGTLAIVHRRQAARRLATAG